MGTAPCFSTVLTSAGTQQPAHSSPSCSRTTMDGPSPTQSFRNWSIRTESQARAGAALLSAVSACRTLGSFFLGTGTYSANLVERRGSLKGTGPRVSGGTAVLAPPDDGRLCSQQAGLLRALLPAVEGSCPHLLYRWWPPIVPAHMSCVLKQPPASTSAGGGCLFPCLGHTKATGMAKQRNAQVRRQQTE